MRNIIRDGRVSLIFLVPGSTTAIRVNGTAKITADPDLRARFDRDGTQPRSVIVIRTTEVYSQCARALQRSALWTAPHAENLPTPGQMLQDATQVRSTGLTMTPSAPPARIWAGGSGQSCRALRARKLATLSRLPQTAIEHHRRRLFLPWS